MLKDTVARCPIENTLTIVLSMFTHKYAIYMPMKTFNIFNIFKCKYLVIRKI
ncbi:hypothetical protein KsCSTR_15120 [Candidatus Kuenenia stuttgartiensis]|uniref:Uncharacterized protein n=1 Tax=Kuenenia stuttgartiensis TaxID=174633 RepID=Q1Q1H8_KUEST|nr:hypothetical protein KsCSTR_15120 [Candidatus Kuenenia stuttgartiensis]CAJ73865.1 unknown protein [Candidatus Kuenenia stuttgartiensis]